MDIKKKRGKAIRNYLTMLVLFIGVFAFFWIQVSNASKSQDEEGARIARESIYRAVLTCYAQEGAYPASYEYIKQNYGIAVDETRYAVFYDIFASNIMPDITVLERSR